MQAKKHLWVLHIFHLYTVYHKLTRILFLSSDLLSSCLEKVMQLKNLMELILIRIKERKGQFFFFKALLLIGSPVFKARWDNREQLTKFS